MKVCPGCSFANDERFPTCVVCNTFLVDVPSTPSANPHDREHQRRALARERRAITRRQIAISVLFYALFITLSAVFPGGTHDLAALLGFTLSSVVLIAAVLSDIAGQFSACALQGAMSVALALHFGPVHPFTFFLLAGHVLAPAVFWHSVDLIHGANR